MGKKKQEKKTTPIAAFYRHVLAVNVRITRNRKGMTQEKLAELCHICPNHVINIEGGKASVGLDILAALVNALGITASQLLDPEWPKKVALHFPVEDEEG